MSQTEYFKGTIKKIETEDIEKHLSDIHGKLPKYFNNWMECIKDEYFEDYIYNHDTDEVYEILTKKEYVDNADIFEASLNDDGIINYEVKYYNGGCGFSEAISAALNAIKTV